MKKLLLLILLLPLWVNAQTNGTIQKTSATGTIRGSFGSLGLDTLPRVTGALVDGYILKYHAATNKWYASPDPTLVGLQDSLTKKANRTFDNVASGAIAKAKVDTSSNGLLPKSNLFPLGDTRWAKSVAVQDSLNTRVKKSGDTMTGPLNGTNIVLSGNVTADTLKSGDAVVSGTMLVGGTTPLAGSLSPLEINASDAGIAIASSSSASNGEAYVAGFLNQPRGYNKSGVLAFTKGKANSDAVNVHASYYVGNTQFDDYIWEGWGKNGMTVFPLGGGDTTSAPGMNRFRVRGSIQSDWAEVGTAGTDSVLVREISTGRYKRIAPNYYATTTALGNYLPLAGGTLTGAVTGVQFNVAGNTSYLEGLAITNSSTTGSSALRSLSGTNIFFARTFSESHASQANKVWIGGDGSNTQVNLQSGGVDFLTGTSSGVVGIPNLGGSGDVIVGSNNSGTLSEIAIGSGLSLAAGVLTATGGSSGSVTTAGGTAGKIAKFTSASNIENSIMTESGSEIQVAGSVSLTNLLKGTQSSNSAILHYLSNTSTGTSAYTQLSLGNSNGDGVGFIRTLGGGFTTSSYNEQDAVVLGSQRQNLHLAAENNKDVKIWSGASNIATFSNGGNATISGNITAANLSGTNTGDQTSVTGNAGTATALQTARNIQGVSFNGTADINPINGTGFVKATGTALSYDNSTYLTTSSASSTYAPISSPTFTGTVSGITAAMVGAPSGSGTSSGTNTGDQTWTTLSGKPTFATVATSGAYSDLSGTPSLSGYAPLASPALTGSPTAPTQTQGDNSTKIATTAYVDGILNTALSATKSIATVYTNANTTGTSLTDLFSWNVAQSNLSADGDRLDFNFAGTYTFGSSNKNIYINIGGNSYSLVGSGNNGTVWSADGYLLRTSSTTFRLFIIGWVTTTISGTARVQAIYDGTVTDFNPLNIKIQGQTDSAGEPIVLKIGSLSGQKAP